METGRATYLEVMIYIEQAMIRCRAGDDRAIHVGRGNISSVAFTFFLPFKRQTILQMVGIFKPHSVLKM